MMAAGLPPHLLWLQGREPQSSAFFRADGTAHNRSVPAALKNALDWAYRPLGHGK